MVKKLKAPGIRKVDMNTTTLDKLFPYHLVNENKNLKTYQGIQICKPLCLPWIPSLSCWLYENHY